MKSDDLSGKEDVPNKTTESDLSSQMFTGLSPGTQKDKINKVDLFTSGAHDNFETMTSSFSNNFAPPPKVVSTTTKYKLF